MGSYWDPIGILSGSYYYILGSYGDPITHRHVPLFPILNGGGALRELPEGVRDLAAADVLMDVAEHVGAAAGVGAVLALLCVNRTI